jgi:serine phosphatase RsbU (regulator of sigma subunit)
MDNKCNIDAVKRDFTDAGGVNFLVLSEEIKPGHPFWDEMVTQGYNPLPADSYDSSSGCNDIQALIISDASGKITPEIVNWLSHQDTCVANYPRILIGSADDYLIDFKKQLYDCQTFLEINLNDPSSVENGASSLHSIAEKISQNSHEPPDWQAFAMHMLGKIRESHIHKGLIENVGSLAPLINEYEFAIKSALKLVAEAFKAPMASILIVQDQSIYTLINEQVTKNSFTDHLEFFRQQCTKNIDCESLTDIVWGRRFIKTNGLDFSNYPVNFIIEPIQVNENVLGFWSIPLLNEKYYDNYLSSVLTKQIFMLLYSSLLYKAQKRINQNHFLRLGAINEVCGLFTNPDSKNFGLQFLLILIEHLSADKGVLALMDEDANIVELHAAGIDEETKAWMKLGETSIPWNEIFGGNGPTSGYLDDRRLCRDETKSGMHYIAYPLSDVQGKIGVVLIMFMNPPGSETDFLPFFQTMATLASTHFANINLYQQFLEKRLMEEQITIARDIQRELLPTEIPLIDDFLISAASRSAKQVGGDFYDLIPLPEKKYVALIGDVSGKGIPASLLMSMAKSLLKFRLLRSSDLPKVISEVNIYLANETPAEKFVTGQAILIDQISKRISFVNAGHGPLLVYRALKDDFEELDAEGLALGILCSAEYELVETTYDSGDIFILYTDGLSEAMSPTRELFGVDRIKQIIKQKARIQPSILLEEFYSAILKHANGIPQHDDTTVIVIKAK